MSRGLVIGKFLPYHRGHASLIATASERCDEVTVVVCDSPHYGIPLDQRVRWIRQSAPDARVMTMNGDELGLADDDSAGWARATIEAIGRPDVVFSSEHYGPRYAELMKSEHMMVDLEREKVSISATEIRLDLLGNLRYLEPHVRADLIPRIAVLGAESTGKTTLCSDLSERLGVPYVPEFGRLYTEAMPDPPRYTWSRRDFEVIAETQVRFEDDAARWVDGPLICDTNPFVTAVFAEAYLGEPMGNLEAVAADRTYALHVLTDPTTPFEHDSTGLRVDGERRQWMHRRYLEHLTRTGAHFIEVSGDRGSRVGQALDAIDELADVR